MSDRPSDAAMWASVADTLRTTVLPNVSDPEARSSTIQLIALAIYAGRRGDDPTERRLDQLAEALEGSAGKDVLRSCSAVLADPGHRLHGYIRNVLERQLEEDVAVEDVLRKALARQLPNG